VPPPTGRPPNWVLQRRLAQSILGKEGTPEYKEYCETTRRHLLAGILPPAIYTLILHYGYGKPVEEIDLEVRTPDPLASLSEDELRERARRLAMARFILPSPEETVDGETVQRELPEASMESQMEAVPVSREPDGATVDKASRGKP